MGFLPSFTEFLFDCRRLFGVLPSITGFFYFILSWFVCFVRHGRAERVVAVVEGFIGRFCVAARHGVAPALLYDAFFFLESNRMASSCGRKITRKQTTATAQGASFLSFLFGLVRSGFSAGWYRTGFFYRRRDASFVAAAAVVTAAFTSAILGGRIVVEGLGEYEDGRLYCFDRPRSLSSRTRPFPYCGRNHFSRT